MENLYITIRHMTSDSRMISINTDTPQYKVDQLKRDLFLKEEDQPEEVCRWWLRLYQGGANKQDKEELKRRISKM